MTTVTRRSPLTPIRIQYFLYFGVLGIYLPYFNLYCYHLDFSGTQIGALSAVRSLLMVVFALIWGTLADRYRIRRQIFITCILLSTAAWSLYLLSRDFWPMLWITVLFGIFYAPIISFLEAFTMDALGFKKARYGRIRVWGSISFILMVILLGALIDHFTIRLILYLILGGFVLQAVGALRMPRLLKALPQSFAPLSPSISRVRILLFLICGFLMLVSHGAYYGFFSIHLETLGYSTLFTGICWALASTSEILVMLNSERIFRRFSLETVLLVSFLIAALRWLVLYWVETPALVLLSQTLHAFTYGGFHMASILYIDRMMPAQAKTLGQAANNAVQYGLGLMVGFFLNGYLYERIGSGALFAVSAVIALVGAGLFGAQIKAAGRSPQPGGASVSGSDRPGKSGSSAS
jgi:PPP family 3-phenylpropionic acid transporter